MYLYCDIYPRTGLTQLSTGNHVQCCVPRNSFDTSLQVKHIKCVYFRTGLTQVFKRKDKYYVPENWFDAGLLVNNTKIHLLEDWFDAAFLTKIFVLWNRKTGLTQLSELIIFIVICHGVFSRTDNNIVLCVRELI